MHSFLTFYGKICAVINKGAQLICFISLVLTFILVMYQIIGRFVVGISIAWSMEFVSYSLTTVAIFGSTSLVYSKSHIKVELFSKRFSKKIGLFISMLGKIILIYYMWLLGVFGYRFALMGKGILSYSEAFDIFYPRLILPIGALIIVVQATRWLLIDLVSIVEQFKKPV